jgi:hypothetical protein
MPVGQPTSPLVLQSDPSGRTHVAYTVANRFLVCVEPDRDTPLWAVRAGEEAETAIVGAPQAAAGGRWIATDLAGRLVVHEGASGKVEMTLEIRLPGAVPAVAAGPLGSASILTALSDGSGVVIPLPAAGAPEPIP